jgi:hypothetical protein
VYISLVPVHQLWCLTVGNNSILFAIPAHLTEYKGNRAYTIHLDVAKVWLGVLDQIRQRNIRTKDFQNSLRGKTLIATYVSNPWHSKVMLHQSKNLVFNGIIKQDATDGYVWELPEAACKFFKKWSLDTVPWARIGFYNDIYSVFDAIYAEYENIKSGKISIVIIVFRVCSKKRKRSLFLFY